MSKTKKPTVIFMDIDSVEWKENSTKLFHKIAAGVLSRGDSTLYGMAFSVKDKVYGFRVMAQELGKHHRNYNCSSAVVVTLPTWPDDKGRPAKEALFAQVKKVEYGTSEEMDAVKKVLRGSTTLGINHQEGDKTITFSLL